MSLTRADIMFFLGVAVVMYAYHYCSAPTGE